VTMSDNGTVIYVPADRVREAELLWLVHRNRSHVNIRAMSLCRKEAHGEHRATPPVV